MGRSFDGSGDKVVFGDVAVFQITGDLSWGLWINFASTSDSTLIAAVEPGAGETEADNSMLYVQVQGTSNNWDIRYIHEYSSGSNEDNRFNVNLLNNVWIHIALVRNVSANTVVLYIDGTASGGTFNYTNDPTTTSSTADYHLGERIDGSQDFTGYMAEAVLANVAWTIGEVQQIRSRASIARGLVHYAPLFGVSSPEPDFSGNGNDGTVTGTAIVDHPPVAPPFGFDEPMSFVTGAAPPATARAKFLPLLGVA